MQKSRQIKKAETLWSPTSEDMPGLLYYSSDISEVMSLPQRDNMDIPRKHAYSLPSCILGDTRTQQHFSILI